MNVRVSLNTYTDNTSRLDVNAASVTINDICQERNLLGDNAWKEEILEEVVSVVMKNKEFVMFRPGCACSGSLSVFVLLI